MQVGFGDSIKADQFGAYDLGFDQIKSNLSTSDIARGIWTIGREVVVSVVELTSSFVGSIASRVHMAV